MPTRSVTKIDKNIRDHFNVKGRILPQNNEAEQALIGCILLDDNAVLKVLDDINDEDFYSQAHKAIFRAMQQLAVEDKPIDLITLIQRLDINGDKVKVGGVEYVASLTDIVPSSDNYHYYKDIVKKNGLLRQLIKVSGDIADNCFAGDPTDTILQQAEQSIYSVGEKSNKTNFIPIGTAVFDAIQEIEKVASDPKSMRGIKTPFKGLNFLLGGLQRSDLILIAARPGQGKTSIGMNLISYAALANVRKTNAGKNDPYKCAVFSLEMPATQLAKRMLCSVARVDMSRANSGDISNKEWQYLFEAKSKLDNASIYIDDNSLNTPIEILSKCRKLKREGGLDLIMIDYLQLMSSGRKVESRQQEISEITRTLKIAAKELNIPILLLSQMSREVEKRQDKKPQMSDLRESGAIEQDADIIIFIYRKYDNTDFSVDENLRSMVELHIAKHRNGATGVVELRWDGKTVSFMDIDNSINIPGDIINQEKRNTSKDNIEKKQSKKITSINIKDNPIDILPPIQEYSEKEIEEINALLNTVDSE